MPFLAFVVFEDYISTSQPGFQPIILVLLLSLVSLSLGQQIGNLCMWAQAHKYFGWFLYYAFQVLNYLSMFKCQRYLPKKSPLTKKSCFPNSLEKADVTFHQCWCQSQVMAGSHRWDLGSPLPSERNFTNLYFNTCLASPHVLSSFPFGLFSL